MRRGQPSRTSGQTCRAAPIAVGGAEITDDMPGARGLADVHAPGAPGRARMAAARRPTTCRQSTSRRTTRAQGHLNSDGLCFVKRNHPSPPWTTQPREGSNAAEAHGRPLATISASRALGRGGARMGRPGPEGTMNDHKTHPNHAHLHQPGCGHLAVAHDGHTDYLHDGHLHRMQAMTWTSA